MAKYHRGRKREYRVKEILERQGYNVVRSAASKGMWDLLAWKGCRMRFIQVKSRKPSKKEMERYLTAVKGPLEVSCEVWVSCPRKGFNVYSNEGDRWIIERLSTN